MRAPAPASPAPVAQFRELRAGLARAEITPPMGAGLFGYGPEGKKPEGYRHRLYALAYRPGAPPIHLPSLNEQGNRAAGRERV